MAGVWCVRRWVVKPCEKTPSGTLELSGIDKVPVLRCNARTLHVYKSKGQESTPKACSVIKEALSKALVPYYPLAGRLSADLHIQCTAEGVLLVEASADSTLHALNYLDNPNSYNYEDLLPRQHQLPLHHQPLVQIQVTQFACGGFVIGLIFSHTVCDGLGAAQFLNAVGEFARGLDKPSVQPVWCRDFFVKQANNGELAAPPMPMPHAEAGYKLEQENVDISTEKINNLKQQFKEETGQRCSTFEIVAAAFWRCRGRAIAGGGEREESSLVFFANCRGVVEPPLAKGFYGNCFFPVRVRAPKQWVEKASLSEVVKLIQKAKKELPKEFEKYRKGEEEEEEDPFMAEVSYDTVFLSEWGRLGFNDVDFGWGPPLHVLPIQGSPIIPAGILGWLPSGIRLMTWCVDASHRQTFLNHLSDLFSLSLST